MSDAYDIEAIHDDQGIIGFPIPGDTLLYHWSPNDRHDLIADAGLRIRSSSVHAPIRYPMICLSLDPLAAWSMSGGTFVTDRPTWDLWGVYAQDLRHGFEVIPHDDRTIREIRVYRSIPARFVHHVATRGSST